MTRTYESHRYGLYGDTLLIKGTGISILASEEGETVVITADEHPAVLITSSDPHTVARNLANIIFNTNKEYAS